MKNRTERRRSEEQSKRGGGVKNRTKRRRSEEQNKEDE